jgi:hypothetical protein
MYKAISMMRCTKKIRARQVDRRVTTESDTLDQNALRSRILLGAQSWASSQKQERGNAMLVQIDQNFATVTPFGSLGTADYSAKPNGGRQSFGRQPNAIRAAWRWICHLFATA